MKVALVSDAWEPQVNGVVTTLRNTARGVRELGHEIELITPEGFRAISCPGYREIRLSLRPYRHVARRLDAAAPDVLHIATEGPLGWAARRWCLANDFPFATSYHTNFPEYVRLRAPVPVALTYRMLLKFHDPAHTTLVRSHTQRRLLEDRGFRHLRIWPGAVDTELFRPRGKSALDLPRPVSLFLGRVAVEKGLEAFLELDLPGSQVVIGEGPDRARLERAFPKAHFLGAHHGEPLARLVSAADVFVFPSRTDTLGLVMLEAMACGVPVAAFPVPGPQDVVIDGSTGALDVDLEAAVFRALRLDGEACVEFAQEHGWAQSTRRFLDSQRTAAGNAVIRSTPLFEGPPPVPRVGSDDSECQGGVPAGPPREESLAAFQARSCSITSPG